MSGVISRLLPMLDTQGLRNRISGSADTLSALTTIPSGQECPRSHIRRLQAFEDQRAASLAPKGLARLTQYEPLKFPLRPIQPFGISPGSGVPPVPVRPRAENPAEFSRSELLTEPEDPDFLRGRTRRGWWRSRTPLRPSGRSRKRSTTSLHHPFPI